MEDKLPIPKPNNLPWLLLVIAAFIIGTLWTKVQVLQQPKNSPSVAGTKTNEPTVDSSPLANDKLQTYAKELKLDTKAFESCLTSGAQTSSVNNDLSEGSNIGVNGTPAFFVNGYMISGAQPFDNFKQVIDFLLKGGTLESKNLPTSLETLVKQGAVSVEKKTVNIGSAPTKGSANAKITLVEYSDFECPFCQRAYGTVKQILKTYASDLRFVYKHYPLTQIHPHAQKAAEAANCAAQQGKFWDYHDKLFEVQGAQVS